MNNIVLLSYELTIVTKKNFKKITNFLQKYGFKCKLNDEREYAIFKISKPYDNTQFLYIIFEKMENKEDKIIIEKNTTIVEYLLRDNIGIITPEQPSNLELLSCIITDKYIIIHKKEIIHVIDKSLNESLYCEEKLQISSVTFNLEKNELSYNVNNVDVTLELNNINNKKKIENCQNESYVEICNYLYGETKIIFNLETLCGNIYEGLILRNPYTKFGRCIMDNNVYFINLLNDYNYHTHSIIFFPNKQKCEFQIPYGDSVIKVVPFITDNSKGKSYITNTHQIYSLVGTDMNTRAYMFEDNLLIQKYGHNASNISVYKTIDSYVNFSFFKNILWVEYMKDKSNIKKNFFKIKLIFSHPLNESTEKIIIEYTKKID